MVMVAVVVSYLGVVVIATRGDMAALGGGHNAAVRDQVMFQPHALHILGVLGSMGGGLLFWGTVWHGGGPFLPTKSVRRAVQNPAIP